MRLLVYLAGRAGEVVSIDELLKEVWSGVIVTSDSVYQAIASLRRTLGDDPKAPTYIATVPRRGYRLIAPVATAPTVSGASARAATQTTVSDVTFSDSQSSETASLHHQAAATQPRSARYVWLVVGVAMVAIVGVLTADYWSHTRGRTTAVAVASTGDAAPRNSIAVVPFIDLTAGMSHEYFADGITEEVIDKLSKTPDLLVTPPTTSFYLKNKQIAIADIAKQLHVAYVLDGSVRKSGETLRVAARLTRGDNGYVVWSQTYDRPFKDLLAVQADIAMQVAMALKASIDTI